MPPILPGYSVKAQYRELCEPSVPAPVQNVNQWVSSGAIAFNAASPVVLTLTIPPNPTIGGQPICNRGKWRVRVSGVDANTTIGAGSVTVSDGTNTCRVGGTGAAAKGVQVDQGDEIMPINNNSNFGGASDGMPTNINSISLSLVVTTTTGSGNIIGDIALEFFGGP
jgi:hypothetical protein